MTRDRAADRVAFTMHLTEQGYSLQTKASTLKAVLRLERALAEGEDVYGLPKRLQPLLQRLLDWPGPGFDDLRAPAQAFITATTQRETKAQRKRRRRQVEARSFEDSDWRQLVALLRERALDSAAPSVEAAALWVIAETGLRVGDLLRLEKRAVCAGSQARERIELVVKGNKTRTLLRAGAPEAWDRLAELWARSGGRNDPRPSVASLVTDSVDQDASSWGAAYKRLERAAKAFGVKAGVSGRLNLHRFRRTVGVQALRVTKGDVRAVQELLGHESYTTTLGYLDEARPDRVAEVQAQVRAAFQKETTKP